ncbi:MAG: hypothetical protein NC489_44295, partial [Ruminococcus flavefaciens]|nr:hypothetical protein [Ruminococcus flavefaciens]
KETYKLEATDAMRNAVYSLRKMTLTGDILLKFSPLLNLFFPNRYKVGQMLYQHNTRDLKKVERRIRQQVLKVSENIEDFMEAQD